MAIAAAPKQAPRSRPRRKTTGTRRIVDHAAPADDGSHAAAAPGSPLGDRSKYCRRALDIFSQRSGRRTTGRWAGTIRVRRQLTHGASAARFVPSRRVDARAGRYGLYSLRPRPPKRAKRRFESADAPATGRLPVGDTPASRPTTRQDDAPRCAAAATRSAAQQRRTAG